MAHEHTHSDHTHDHSDLGHHHHSVRQDPSGTAGAEPLDLSIPDTEISPAALGRRKVLQGAGLLGAGLTAASVLTRADTAAAAGVPAAARASNSGKYAWLSGDHHIHTQYSPDAQYRVIDQVRHAADNRLDWMVITDHGSLAHAKFGVEKVNPDIRAARAATPGTLVFQGVEWNIPAAEHGTVFVHPGPNEVAVLQGFEQGYDGVVKTATDSTPANEALAISGLAYLARAVRTGKVADALMLANHPARKGLDSPHEIRNWRDQGGGIAVGFEGAPGHQAGGIKAPLGAGGGRGDYDFAPSANSFAAYPPESYRTWGGFDWMTATVGGLWDSLLTEGKPWWITANSDSHKVYADWSKNPVDNNPDAPWDAAGDTFDTFGRYGDPVYAGGIQTSYSDFWPGFYSRTHVGARSRSYTEVMKAVRAGRIWVDHGGLLDRLDVRLSVDGSNRAGATLGGILTVEAGQDLTLTIDVTPASGPNRAQFQPALSRVDLIAGDVMGPSDDRDTFATPNTKVIATWDTSLATSGPFTLTYLFPAVESPFYLRVRGSDGNRSGVGYYGAKVDPLGPAQDVVGDADPWADLWFYTNPIWALTPSPLRASSRIRGTRRVVGRV